MNIQLINNSAGLPEYVVMTVSEYERLTKRDITSLHHGFDESDDDEKYEDIAYESDDTDDATIPNEVVKIAISEDVSLLAAWRIHKGLTQADVYELTGISQASLSQMEQIGKKPQSKTCNKLAEAYGCLPEQLLD